MSKEDVEKLIAAADAHMQKTMPILDKFERASMLNWLRSKLSQAPVEEQLPANGNVYVDTAELDAMAQKEQKEGCCELCRATLHNGVWTCWKLFKGCCHTPQTPTPTVKEEECKKCEKFGVEGHDCCHGPRPVKEESHTQGWDGTVNRLVRDFTKVGASKSFVRTELDKFIKEVIAAEEKRAMLRQRHYDERIMRERETKAFEAGRLQGAQTERQFFLNVLDGVDIANEQMGLPQDTKAIRFALQSRSLTALSSLTHKE